MAGRANLNWENPDKWAVTPKKPKPPLKGQVRKCGCGCGESAGRDRNGKPRRFLPGHQVSKMSLENQRYENEMALEMAEAAARQEFEDVTAEIDRLIAEANELGLTGDAKIAYVFNDDMEDAALRKQMRRAVLESSKEAANWLYGRKHGSVNKGGAAQKKDAGTDISNFLDADHVVPEAADEWDD